MDRLNLALGAARRALSTLEELAGGGSPTPVERDAAIQRFEYTFEATWKLLSLYLRDREGVVAASPKSAFRAAMRAGLLAEEDARLALDMADDRNLTVHTYIEELAARIYARLPAYAALLRRVIETASAP